MRFLSSLIFILFMLLAPQILFADQKHAVKEQGTAIVTYTKHKNAYYICEPFATIRPNKKSPQCKNVPYQIYSFIRDLRSMDSNAAESSGTMPDFKSYQFEHRGNIKSYTKPNYPEPSPPEEME